MFIPPRCPIAHTCHQSQTLPPRYSFNLQSGCTIDRLRNSALDLHNIKRLKGTGTVACVLRVRALVAAAHWLIATLDLSFLQRGAGIDSLCCKIFLLIIAWDHLWYKLPTSFSELKDSPAHRLSMAPCYIKAYCLYLSFGILTQAMHWNPLQKSPEGSLKTQNQVAISCWWFPHTKPGHPFTHWYWWGYMVLEQHLGVTFLNVA